MMYVFVYGTLKRGFDNHALLEHSEFVGRAITLRPYHMRCCGFPIVFAQPATAHIEGELFKLNSKHTIHALDRLEGTPMMYLRERVEVDVPAINQQLEAYMYFGNAKNWNNRSRLPEVPVSPTQTYVWSAPVYRYQQGARQ